MKLIQFNTRPSARQLAQFGVAWVIFFLLLLGFMVAAQQTSARLWTMAIVAIIPPLIGWRIPGFMRVLYLLLAVVAYPIGYVVSHLILVVLYYLVLTPTGLILRTVKPGFFPKKPDSNMSTYWSSNRKKRTPKDYFKPY